MRHLYGFLGAVTFTLMATIAPRASGGETPSLPQSPQTVHQDTTLAHTGTLTGDVAVTTLGTHRIVIAVDTEDKDGRTDSLFTVDVKTPVPFPLSTLLQDATVRFSRQSLSIDGTEDFEFQMANATDVTVNGERDSSRLVFNTVLGLMHRVGLCNQGMSLAGVAGGRVPGLPPHPFNAKKAPEGRGVKAQYSQDPGGGGGGGGGCAVSCSANCGVQGSCSANCQAGSGDCASCTCDNEGLPSCRCS